MHEDDELAYRSMLGELSKAFVSVGLRSDCDSTGPLACRSADGRILINAFIVPQVTVFKEGVRHRLGDPHIQVMVTVNGNSFPPMYRELRGEPRIVAKSVLYLVAHLLAKHAPEGAWLKKLGSGTPALDPSPEPQKLLSPQ